MKNLTFEEVLTKSFKACAKAYGWGPKEMEETNLETLLDFWSCDSDAPSEKVINGIVYKLASSAPAFL